MPTGYTSYINDGEITSGKEFFETMYKSIWSCC